MPILYFLLQTISLLHGGSLPICSCQNWPVFVIRRINQHVDFCNRCYLKIRSRICLCMRASSTLWACPEPCKHLRWERDSWPGLYNNSGAIQCYVSVISASWQEGNSELLKFTKFLPCPTQWNCSVIMTNISVNVLQWLVVKKLTVDNVNGSVYVQTVLETIMVKSALLKPLFHPTPF